MRRINFLAGRRGRGRGRARGTPLMTMSLKRGSGVASPDVVAPRSSKCRPRPSAALCDAFERQTTRRDYCLRVMPDTITPDLRSAMFLCFQPLPIYNPQISTVI